MDTKKYHDQINLFGYLIKRFIFKNLTANSANFFTRGGDSISIAPQINGTYEPEITNLINYFAYNSYDGFFIDIGANIGLISCQVGSSFKEIHMFEPNPLPRKICEVNAAISLSGKNYEIHPYGLGSFDQKVNLTIPKGNWGGAFINNNENSLEKSSLANKDGFKVYSSTNYTHEEITLKNSSNTFAELFDRFEKLKMHKGIIKIDVEGFELNILKGIGNSLPRSMKVVIIFENLNINIDINNLLNVFNGRAKLLKLVKFYPWKKNWPRILKVIIIAATFFRNIPISLGDFEQKDCLGDLVLIID